MDTNRLVTIGALYMPVPALARAYGTVRRPNQ